MSTRQFSTTSDLTVATTPIAASDNRYTFDIPDGWQQGRGAYGGLVLAALARAFVLFEPNKDRFLRSFNAEIAEPVMPGPAEVTVTELRRGNGLSSYTATLAQGGKNLVHSSAVLARARNADPPQLHMAIPTRSPWRDIEPLPLNPNVPFVPTFLQHVEMRSIGPLPFSGAKVPVTEGWVRMRVPTPSLDAPEIIALADTWWPSLLTAASSPRPMATVAFTLQYFPATPPVDPVVPLYYRGRVVAEQEGYFAESRELWTEDGRLLALNQQTIAQIK
ncbi:MAG: thioesterase family protein [Polyangiaceae bacterium]|nr:thioesterase family protein [Polyangiaceae bacterium]